jgi:hypothetical protein
LQSHGLLTKNFENQYLRASPSLDAQYVTLDNKIKCLSLAFLLATPTNKTVTGTPHMWGLLIANHLDQSEILIQFITLFFGGA